MGAGDTFRRVQIDDRRPQLVVTIPRRKSRGTVRGHAFELAVFLCVLAWSIAAAPGVYEIDLPAAPFLIFWGVSAGLFGSLCMALLLWWHVRGKEIVIVDATRLTIRKSLSFLSLGKDYDARHISHVRTMGPGRGYLIPNITSFTDSEGTGRLKHRQVGSRYKGQLVRFGVGLDEAKAQAILAAITKQYPELLGETQRREVN